MTGSTKNRLWDKGESLNNVVHRFTVGSDPVIDREIAEWDILASAAHAHVLEQCKVLTADESSTLRASLKKILLRIRESKFEISVEQEDCHTAIEAILTEELGDLGKKIHTGRSRNDQILVAMRLYLKAQVTYALASLNSCREVIQRRAYEGIRVPMPGYTHMQPGMPSTVEMWLSGFDEHLIDLIRDGLGLIERIDASPLGVGSGFGIPLALDRSLSATLLGFSRVQRNPVHVQNSRGREELWVARWLSDIATVIEKLSCDFMLYTTERFGFFKLPVALTTGSSIMPQKRNPDVVELLRGYSSKVRARETELMLITSKLPSNYHRDFQLTKQPVVEALALTRDMLIVLTELCGSFEICSDKLKDAMTDDLYATYLVYEHVRNGMPFRDAYLKVGEDLKHGIKDLKRLSSDFEIIQYSLDADIKERDLEVAALTKRINEIVENMHGIEQRVL